MCGFTYRSNSVVFISLMPFFMVFCLFYLLFNERFLVVRLTKVLAFFSFKSGIFRIMFLAFRNWHRSGSMYYVDNYLFYKAKSFKSVVIYFSYVLPRFRFELVMKSHVLKFKDT